MDRLAARLEMTRIIDREGVSNFVAQVGHCISSRGDNKTPLFKASEFRRLMLVRPVALPSLQWLKGGLIACQFEFCTIPQVLPLALANLFTREAQEASRVAGIELTDPSESMCITLVHWALWYGAARRIPQSLELPPCCILS